MSYGETSDCDPSYHSWLMRGNHNPTQTALILGDAGNLSVIPNGTEPRRDRPPRPQRSNWRKSPVAVVSGDKLETLTLGFQFAEP